jgi:DNA-binding Lrp family transcriptional regulator
VDRVDLAICQILMANSRTPYQELAGILGLSVNAVHKRVKALVDIGIIRAFTARVSLAAVKAPSVWAFGRSDATSVEQLHLELKKNDMVYWVSYSGGGFMYVGGYLRDFSHLDEFSSFVRSVAQIRAPTVGVVSYYPLSLKEELRPLDIDIIRALHRDARKPVSEVAVEVRASARTVQRRLDRMVKEGLVELSLEWYPDISNDIMSVCHSRVSPGKDKWAVGESLRARLAPNVMFNVAFSNIPDQFVSFLWTNSMRELSELKESILKEEGIDSISVNVLSIGYMFDTWRDKLLFREG